MEENKIEEGNRLIAIFTGLEKRDSTSVLYERYNWKGYLFPMHRLRFHLDWEWLMPVVEKIQRLGYGVSIIGESSEINNCNIYVPRKKVILKARIVLQK